MRDESIKTGDKQKRQRVYHFSTTPTCFLHRISSKCHILFRSFSGRQQLVQNQRKDAFFGGGAYEDMTGGGLFV